MNNATINIVERVYCILTYIASGIDLGGALLDYIPVLFEELPYCFL
jgi:hypothetical protein